MTRRLLSTALAAALCLAALPAAAQGFGAVERNQSAFSPALGRPLVYNVYRPASAPKDGARWPVLFLLEGRPSESDWLDQGFVFEIIDRAVDEGVIPPTLVVMPVAPFSWYIDNADPGGQGMMATAIARDLTGAIDARYPTAACREARSVGGLSMGGYGAVLFGLDHPDAFGAAMSFAGAITPPIAPKDAERLARADAFYDGAFGRPLSRERFNAWNVFTRARAAADRPGQRAAFYIAAGDRDRAGLLQSATLLHVTLGRRGFDSTLRIGPGAHDWETWRRQLGEALAWLGPRLDPSCGQEVAGASKNAASP
ncbi:alpha/beta hydrolase [Hansschlegelia zhihuaiae]|uniref:alpha/beta hydrolase n=1 Tax=Hansschlegelia zhihuaiae TaxID=405005 RepID=UPI001FDF1B83|nr:alpha/beta hydrolase-fold protein [Hansschlegelia zhihuaiae]